MLVLVLLSWSWCPRLVRCQGALICAGSVTDKYGWRLRKGLVSLGLVALRLLLGPGVVDTFWACFFFLLLLWVIHGFVSAIDCCYTNLEFQYWLELPTSRCIWIVKTIGWRNEFVDWTIWFGYHKYIFVSGAIVADLESLWFNRGERYDICCSLSTTSHGVKSRSVYYARRTS